MYNYLLLLCCRALHYAASLEASANLIECLLSYGADVDIQNEDGCTALFNATQTDNQFSACVLIEHEANVRHKNVQGMFRIDSVCLRNFPLNLQISCSRFQCVYILHIDPLSNTLEIVAFCCCCCQTIMIAGNR